MYTYISEAPRIQHDRLDETSFDLESCGVDVPGSCCHVEVSLLWIKVRNTSALWVRMFDKTFRKHLGNMISKSKRFMK